MENQEPSATTSEPSTVTKTKHPGRVKAGNKLAEYNRKIKSQLLEQPDSSEPHRQTNKETNFNYTYLGVFIPFGFLIAYKLYKKSVKLKTNKQDTQVNTPQHERPIPITPTEPDLFEMR